MPEMLSATIAFGMVGLTYYKSQLVTAHCVAGSKVLFLDWTKISILI